MLRVISGSFRGDWEPSGIARYEAVIRNSVDDPRVDPAMCRDHLPGQEHSRGKEGSMHLTYQQSGLCR